MKTKARRGGIWKLPMVMSISVFIIVSAMLIKEYTEDAEAQSEFEVLAQKVSLQSSDADDTSVKAMDEGGSTETVYTETDLYSDETVQADETTEPEGEGVLAKYEALIYENPDLGGWIRIDGTKIDYPVMYTPEEPEKYLHLSFAGEYSSRGVPFIGEGCSINPRSDNIIVYGHHMQSGMMFAALVKYRSKSFLEQHRTIYFSTIYEENYYEIYTVFETDAYAADDLRCYSLTDYADEADFNKFKKDIDSVALYDTGADIEYGDELLILSTCSYHTSEGRFVVVAKKVK